MDVEVKAVGGYAEFGRNMTCVRIGREAVIFDMGLRMDRVLLHEDLVFEDATSLDLQALGAIPDDSVLRGMDAKVKAIVLNHGHLDHVGAVIKLARHYKCPIIATPYTVKIIQDESLKGRGRNAIPNAMIPLKAGQRHRLGPHLEIEFVNITHSIAQTVLSVLHTPKGSVVYALDFKMDNSPVIGEKPDYRRMRSLGMEGVHTLIVETTRAHEETKTPSESIARDMLKDYLFGLDIERHGVLVTTFSSHTARIKSIMEFGHEMGREVLLLGRSMEKYTRHALDLGIIKPIGNARAYGDPRSVEQQLKRVAREGPEKFLLVVTGHQGEENALLSRIANKDTPLKLARDDHVIFSADTIPHPINVANRYTLETKLKLQGAILIKGAHVSGHGSREDHRELLRMLEPRNIFPTHGNMEHLAGYTELAERHGWKLNDSVHLMRNGQSHTMKG